MKKIKCKYSFSCTHLVPVYRSNATKVIHIKTVFRYNIYVKTYSILKKLSFFYKVQMRFNMEEK